MFSSQIMSIVSLALLISAPAPQESNPQELAKALRFYANQSEANLKKIVRLSASGNSESFVHVKGIRFPIINSDGSSDFRSVEGPFFKFWEASFVLQADLIKNETITKWNHVCGPLVLDIHTREEIEVDGYTSTGVSSVSLSTDEHFISKEDFRKPTSDMPNSRTSDPSVFQRLPPDSNRPPEALDPKSLFRLEADHEFGKCPINC